MQTTDYEPGRALAGAQLITPRTNLRISSYNAAAGVTLKVIARIMTFQGQITYNEFDHIPNTDRSQKQTTAPLVEGWLVSIQTYASAGTPRRGQCFVRVELVQGDTGALVSVTTLLQNYVESKHAINWPGSPLVSSVDGPGCLRSITGTDPAAGVEISETVPAGARWRPISIASLFTTSATVATRVIAWVIDDGANNVLATLDVQSQVASQAVTHSLAALGNALGASAVVGTACLPALMTLPAGARIRTSTVLIQAGDNWNAPQMLVEEWIEP